MRELQNIEENTKKDDAKGEGKEDYERKEREKFVLLPPSEAGSNLVQEDDKELDEQVTEGK